jgi:hypothetical protein
MGDIRGAQAARETARKEKADASRFELEKAKALATLDARALQATRPNAKGAGAGAGPKVAEQLAEAEYKNLLAISKPKPGESAEAFDKRIRVEALRATQAQVAQKFSSSVTDNPEGGPRARKLKADADAAKERVTAEVNRKVMDNMKIWGGGIEARKAQANGPGAFAKAKETAEKEFRRQATQGMSNSGGAATPPPNSELVLNYDANGRRIK